MRQEVNYMYESKKVMVSYAKDDFGIVDALIKKGFDMSIYPAWVLEEISAGFRGSIAAFPPPDQGIPQIDLCIILFSQQYLAVCSDDKNHCLWKTLLQRGGKTLFILLDPLPIPLMETKGIPPFQILNGETNSCKSILLKTAQILTAKY